MFTLFNGFPSPPAATLDPSVAAPGSRLESMLAGGFGGTGGGSNRVDPQLQPLLGVAPLGPIPLSSDRVVQLRMLESSYKHLPQLSDSERVRYGYLAHVSVAVCNCTNNWQECSISA